MFPRSRRGDGTMIWMIVFALLALVVLGLGLFFLDDVFGGVKSDTDALQACEGLVGQLAGGTGYCFPDQTCTLPSGSNIEVENGEWVYVGEKGCRAKSESAPACCVLLGKEGSASKSAVLEKSCSGFEPGSIALVDNVQCTNVADLTTLELEHSYTAIRYYLKSSDQKSGKYTTRMILSPAGSQNPFSLFRVGDAKSGSPYVEISLKYAQTAQTNGYTFFNFLAGAPESKDILSNLNNGGSIKITVLSPLGVLLSERTLQISAPTKKICSAQSDALCVNAFAGSEATVLDSASGITWRPFCEISSDGSCEYLNEKSNPGKISCSDIQGTLFDSNSDCYLKVPLSSTYGNPMCKVASSKIGSGGRLGCTLIRIEEGKGICQENSLSGNIGSIPDCQ